MIKAELYHKTVGILFDAYFNDTLRHMNCHACAVGNIVAANCGYRFEEGGLRWVGRSPNWSDIILMGFDSRDGLMEIHSTGYDQGELSKIEQRFENAPRGNNDEDRMFNGLVAVLDVLKDIHQVTDQDLLTSNNNRFKEQYEKRIATVTS